MNYPTECSPFFFSFHKQIQNFMETIITRKHLPNSKPILCYGWFTDCLSEFSVMWLVTSLVLLLFLSCMEESFKTCDFSIMGEKKYMQNPLSHMQIYFFLHMKKDRGNRNRNKTPWIQPKKKLLDQTAFHIQMVVCKNIFLDVCKNSFIFLEYWRLDGLWVRSIPPVYIPPLV